MASPRVPGKGVSFWVDTAPETAFPRLKEEIEVDVAVIGGGIAGLTAALLLSKGGCKVAVLEAGRVGTGVTGHTTGKVTSLHRLVYRELSRKWSEDAAAIYGEANQAAVEQVAQLVEEHVIKCDFQRVNNYTFAQTTGGLSSVKQEAELAKRLGLPATFTTDVPLPFPVRGAVCFSSQAQMHSAKYTVGLAQAVTAAGGMIFENTRASGVKDGSPCQVDAGRGKVRARDVLVTTNVPFTYSGLFFLRVHAYRSYLVALAAGEELPDGTFISTEDPIRSILPYHSGRRRLLLVGGEGHRAGGGGNIGERYLRLADFGQKHLNAGAIRYRWSTQDGIPIDGLPFVGKQSPFSRHVYVATGFRKWGLSNATAAAMILSDKLLGKENRWAKVFDTNRLGIRAGGRKFLTENGAAAIATIRGQFQHFAGSATDLGPGEGRVIEKGGKKIAISRDAKGVPLAVSAVCTHLGCTVGWNGADQTWDCPCHGSRFDREGEVIQGPATEPLKRVESAPNITS